jgi:AraC-like DNA-binding protein
MSEKEYLKDKYAHGELMFPLQVYSGDTSLKGFHVNYHWHDELEFEYVVDGKLHIQIDGVVYELNVGEVLVIHGGEIHTCYPGDDSKCIFKSIVFNAGMLESSSFDACQSKYINPLLHQSPRVLPRVITENSIWEKDILLQIRSIFEAYESRYQGFELDIKASLFRILARTAANFKTDGISRDVKEYQMERVKKILNYIHVHYKHKISIHELASVVNMSQYHMCRFFRVLTGRTPVEYINLYRINQAAELLVKNDTKLLDIALEVGFENLSYFIETFKRYKKCTPSKFRCNNQGNKVCL